MYKDFQYRTLDGWSLERQSFDERSPEAAFFKHPAGLGAPLGPVSTLLATAHQILRLVRESG